VLRATLSTKLWQGSVGDKFYTPNVVKRTTVFHYRAGRPVYELVSPKGEVYMMQSYTQIVDATLTMDDLPKLGERLKPPKGWTFRTRVLTDDYALTADGTAYVINDEMYNSYQRRPRPPATPRSPDLAHRLIGAARLSGQCSCRAAAIAAVRISDGCPLPPVAP